MQENASKSKERLGSAIGSHRLGSANNIPKYYYGGPNKIQINHGT